MVSSGNNMNDKNDIENSLAYEYDDEDDMDEENYTEAEIEDIADKNDLIDRMDRQEKKKERLKKLLQMIGIDAGGLSAEVLNELGNKFVSSPNKILPEAGNGVLPLILADNEEKKEEEKEKTIDLSGKYYLILEIEYTPKIEICEYHKLRYNYTDIKPGRILAKKYNLLPEQKELLEFLKTTDFWRNSNIDWQKLFNLIKNSKFKLYLKEKKSENELQFGDAEEKPVAGIFIKESNNYHYGETIAQNEFVFRLEGNFYFGKNTKHILGSEYWISIKNMQIGIYQLSLLLAPIINRILDAGDQYYYYFNNYQNDKKEFIWETELFEKEILEINKVIADAKKYFNLKTNLPAKFEINESKKSSPVIIVDYDNTNSSLNIAATMDYGFHKVDMTHAAFRKLKGGKEIFSRKIFKNREKYHIKIEGNKIDYAKINAADEISLFKKFYTDEKFGFKKNLRCVKNNSKEISHFHKNHWPHIKKLNYPIEFLRDELVFFDENFKADFDVDMNAENDWLAFDVNCYLGKDRISLEDLKDYLKNKEEFIRMNDGRMLRISNWEELERFVMMLESFYQRENGSFEGRAYHAPELQNIFVNSQYYSAKVAEGFKKFINEAQSGRPLEKVKLPAGMRKTLRDYQREGIDWFHFLRKYRFAGILADDMGLGKTLQALTLLEMNKVGKKPSIVVCPKTLLFNWEQEAAKFFPSLKVLIIEGPPKERIKNIGKIKNYDLIITSYSTIKKDGAAYEKKKIKFNYCFLDEAQFIKNHKTQNAQAVKKIDADYKLALTGTPLENSVSEVWSVFDFLMPGFLGKYNHFTKRFLTPIMKKNDAKALRELRKKTECFMLRRTKSEVLKELPPKIEQITVSELTEAQNILYQEILANVKSEIFKTVSEKGFSKSQIHILAGLMKLRQVCNHPTLLLKNKDYTKYESAKLESFKELVSEIVSSNRKVLVFSQFTQMLDILADVLKKDKIEYLYLSGKTKNRKELVDEFNSSEKKKVFLISLKAGGTGLNLTSADNVIIFDPWWNPSVENQAIDRTHRIGQKKSVNVYRLISKGTIEEKILKLQEKKKFLFDNLIGESKDLFKKLTWDDVRELFK